MDKHIPLFQRRRLGDSRRNYLKEGYIANGEWFKMSINVRELINKASKI